MRSFSFVLCIALCVGAALVTFSPLHAGVETVVIPDVKYSNSLSGVVLAPDDSPLANAEVIEVADDWTTVIRVARTDESGRWSLPAVPNQRVYFLRFVTKQCCFNEVQCRVALSKRKGKELRIWLPLST
jgi:hypothetical protein